MVQLAPACPPPPQLKWCRTSPDLRHTTGKSGRQWERIQTHTYLPLYSHRPHPRHRSCCWAQRRSPQRNASHGGCHCEHRGGAWGLGRWSSGRSCPLDSGWGGQLNGVTFIVQLCLITNPSLHRAIIHKVIVVGHKVSTAVQNVQSTYAIISFSQPFMP